MVRKNSLLEKIRYQAGLDNLETHGTQAARIQVSSLLEWRTTSLKQSVSCNHFDIQIWEYFKFRWLGETWKTRYGGKDVPQCFPNMRDSFKILSYRLTQLTLSQLLGKQLERWINFPFQRCHLQVGHGSLHRQAWSFEYSTLFQWTSISQNLLVSSSLGM